MWQRCRISFRLSEAPEETLRARNHDVGPLRSTFERLLIRPPWPSLQQTSLLPRKGRESTDLQAPPPLGIASCVIRALSEFNNLHNVLAKTILDFCTSKIPWGYPCVLHTNHRRRSWRQHSFVSYHQRIVSILGELRAFFTASGRTDHTVAPSGLNKTPTRQRHCAAHSDEYQSAVGRHPPPVLQTER